MFYIHILNQPPHQESNPLIPDSTTDSEQKSLVRHQQMQLRKMHQRTSENYHLERRFFI